MTKVFCYCFFSCFLITGSLVYGQLPEIRDLEFGSIIVNDKKYDDDIVINHGKISERKKKALRELREQYGHTPLTEAENIPWDCDTLVIGIGMSGRLPVTESLKKEAEKRKIILIMLETPEAVKYFQDHYSERTNAVFHITCQIPVVPADRLTARNRVSLSHAS